MSAVQNLKSRWAAVATPLTPASTPTHVPQQAAVKPTTYESPFNSGITAMPTTPTFKSLTPQKNPSLVHHTTPKSSRALKTPPNFSTPRTPNSSLVSINSLHCRKTNPFNCHTIDATFILIFCSIIL